MKKDHLLYHDGYCQALKDLHKALKVWEPSFKFDRRNNIKNIIAVLECLMGNPDVFANNVDQTPMWYKRDKKLVEYFIDWEDWPLNVQRVSIGRGEENKP